MTVHRELRERTLELLNAILARNCSSTTLL
jgi:hypothetical protein